MPYPHSLHRFVLPEFMAEPPREWVDRLRHVSPDLPNMDRLVFRKFEPQEPDGKGGWIDRGWLNKDRPIWALYTAKPIRMVDAERAQQFAKHWSDMPTEKQAGLQGVVSDYQHFMWHTQGLYVKPFLILQGPWGGTPAKYTPEELSFLQGSSAELDPFPIGMFPACPFDERVVKQITLRDRLLKVSGSYDRLERLDTSDAKRAVDDAAELLRRETVLDTLRVLNEPAIEFMKTFLRTKAAEHYFPRPKAGQGKQLASTVAAWREHFLEHGALPSTNRAGQQHTSILVS